MSEQQNSREDAWKEEPLTEEEKQKMAKELSELKKENERLQSETRESYFSYLRGLGGPYTDVLIQEKKEALDNIHNPNPAIREVSLHLSAFYWGMADDIADLCENLIYTDSNERVRLVSVKILGFSYSETKDSRIGRFLSKIVKDENWSDQARLAAYYALIKVDGRHNHGVSQYKLSLMDINWLLVEHYLSERGNEGGDKQ